MSWEQTLADLVEERTGIALAPRQLRPDVRRRIRGRMAELGLASPAAWVWHLARRPPGDPEFAWLVGAVTVGYSYFFRDAEQLAVVVAVLQELQRSQRVPRRSQVWCAGCSTGQEPWSLAILAEQARLPVAILATDLNPDFLDFAREGSYPLKAAGQLPDALRPGLITKADRVVVRDELRPSVRFAQHNLAGAEPYPGAIEGGRFDLILCRNVFIYFSDSVRERVATRLARALDPAGWLFLGPGESLEGLDVALRAQPWERRLGYRHATEPSTERHSGRPRPTVPSLPPRRPPRADPLEGLVRRAASGDAAGAERDLTALALSADNARVWTALAHLRIRLHKLTGALEACAAASGCDALDPHAHLARGVALRKLGDLEAAERALRQALFLDPDCWPAGLLLAGVYGRQGRPAERTRTLRRAREAMARAPASESAPPAFEVEALDRERLRRRLRAEIPSP